MDALALVKIAMDTGLGKDNILYAHLANTAASVYFELNDLKQARPYLETVQDIRRLLDTKEEYSNSLQNMGNLLSAEGSLDEALKSFSEARSIRVELGEDGIVGLALVSLGIGRALALKGKYSQAEENYNVAKKIILRKHGPKGHFMPE